jgi:acetyltransferase-like isoleucine patch superfamily enzyme
MMHHIISGDGVRTNNYEEVIMKDVYIFGTSSSIAQTVAEYLEDCPEYRFLGYLLSAEFCNTELICGYPLLSFESVAEKGGDFSIINCIGYSEMLNNREKVANMIKQESIPLETYIHPSAMVMKSVVGDGNVIMAGAYIGNRVSIGDGNLIAPFSHTEIGCTVGNYNFFGPRSVRLNPVHVNDHCILGGNSTIKNGVTIASYSLIGAGAYITTNTKEYGVYVQPHTRRVKEISSLDAVYYMK